MDKHALIAAARAWLASDPDPHTRAATEALLATGDEAALADHFGARLDFGTAGLRGALGPGPNRMNRALVLRVAAGLVRYLQGAVPGSAEAGVVVGYDGRVGSEVFARDTARVLRAAGFRAWVSPRVCSTPELAFAVTDLRAAAGVMVTASHNPPEDNGYKVYWSNGAQIIPPHDAGIAAAIDWSGPAIEPPDVDLAALATPPEVYERYVAAVLKLRVHKQTDLRVVYTAMHGVGARAVEDVLARAGYTQVFPVEAQRHPDGRFPTVRFPNPEEPGALDLAFALAREVDADLIVANDPDADRLAVAVPDGKGGWRQLSGNQVGCLFADDLLAHGDQWKGAPRLVATTIVSSTLLSRIAEAHGAQYAECLTGFKWIANEAIPFDAAGGHFVLGYEEALGYSAGPVVRDKDGVSAVLLFCDLAAWCKSEGRSILEHLQDLYARHGLYASGQKSLVLPGAAGQARIAEIMGALRASPPRELAGVAVRRVQDVKTGLDTDLATGATQAVKLPKSNVLAWWLADGSRVLVRPSGTEPKIKFYFEVREALREDDTLDLAEGRAAARIEALRGAVSAKAGV
jgi:phosphomannomutase